jgi:hypothetical protein
MKKLYINIAVVLLAVLVFCPSATFILEKDGQRNLISQGRIKTVPQDASEGWTVMDIKKGQILLIDLENKAYALASFDEFCQSMQKLAAKIQNMFSKIKQEKKPAKVEVVKAGSGGKIAGYDTVKYKVMVDGNLQEEVWISSGPEFAKELPPDMLAKLMACGAQKDDVEYSAAYQELMASGWVMRSINYEGGQAETDADVVKVTKQDITESEFQIPQGLKKTSMEELITGQ